MSMHFMGGNKAPTKHRSLQEKKDILQPDRKKTTGSTEVNEEFIKAYGADAHPDPEVQDYYKKRGY